MTRIAPGDVVTLTVSDKYGRVLPPWPYRLQGFEFRAEPGRPTVVCKGRFSPLQNDAGNFKHEWANLSVSERTAVEIDAPWPVAVKLADAENNNNGGST